MFVKSLLQNASNIYYKTHQKLLQNAAAFLLQNAAAFLLQNASILLQNAAGITKRVIYYKMGHDTIYQ